MQGLIEVTGESASGKTQFVLQALLQVRPSSLVIHSHVPSGHSS